MDLSPGHVVLVTGGSGFLAQHLIKELQNTQAKNIKQIRVADRKVFRKWLDYPEHIEVVEHIVDCAEECDMDSVVHGCTVVFNLCAEQYPIGMIENVPRIWRNILTSTQVLLKLMCKYNVTYLANVGDALSICSSWDDCQQPSEVGTLESPPTYMLSTYGEAKFTAEKLVLNSGTGETKLANGEKLRTVSIRPSLMYGEGESLIIPYCYKLAQMNHGWFLRLGEGENIMQLTYAGNVASMLLDACQLIMRESDEYSGEVFFVTENIISTNLLDFVEPYLKLAGFTMSQWALPFELATVMCWFGEKIVRGVARLGLTLPGADMPNATVIRMVGGLNFHFTSTKARLVLDWKAKYEPKEAMRETLVWWHKNYKQFL